MIIGWKIIGRRGQAVAEATLPVREVLPVLQAVQDFGAQLARIDAQQREILAMLRGEQEGAA